MVGGVGEVGEVGGFDAVPTNHFINLLHYLFASAILWQIFSKSDLKIFEIWFPNLWIKK